MYATEKPSPWMCVDTALYVVTGNETKEDSNLVCLTELRDKEVGKYVHFLFKYNSICITESKCLLELLTYFLFSAMIVSRSLTQVPFPFDF